MYDRRAQNHETDAMVSAITFRVAILAADVDGGYGADADGGGFVHSPGGGGFGDNLGVHGIFP